MSSVHYAQRTDPNVFCGETRVHTAKAQGDDVTSDTSKVDCRECLAALIRDETPTPEFVAMMADRMHAEYKETAILTMEHLVRVSNHPTDIAILAELQRRALVTT